MTQTHCAGCSAQFTFILTKHLCRSCGDSFCHGCSSGKRPVPEKGYHESVRVCDVCLHSQDRRAKLLGISTEELRKRDSATVDANPTTHDAPNLRQRESHMEAMNMLKRIYKAKIRPLEHAYKFSEFYSTELTDGDFDSKPFVLLVGQYSVGKVR